MAMKGHKMIDGASLGREGLKLDSERRCTWRAQDCGRGVRRRLGKDCRAIWCGSICWLQKASTIPPPLTAMATAL